MTSPERIETIQMVDALSKAVDILGPQLGTDGIDLVDQIVDVLRFTRLNKQEMAISMYFLEHEEDSFYYRAMMRYLNMKMSEEGHERSRLVSDTLKGLGGKSEPPTQKKDTRGLLARNIWARNKKAEA